MRIARRDIYFKARLVLQALSAGMPDALIDYAEGRGMHRFRISCEGVEVRVEFPRAVAGGV
jgi:hypothetical protein